MTNAELLAKIKAEIERRLKDYWKICFHDVKAYNEDSNVRELKELLSFLSTLEKESEDFPTTDEEMAKFLATHPKVEVPEKYKTPDWLWKKQEQPEVDLEKEIQLYIESIGFGRGGWVDGLSDEDLRDIARHFAQWGAEHLK